MWCGVVKCLVIADDWCAHRLLQLRVSGIGVVQVEVLHAQQSVTASKTIIGTCMYRMMEQQLSREERGEQGGEQGGGGEKASGDSLVVLDPLHELRAGGARGGGAERKSVQVLLSSAGGRGRRLRGSGAGGLPLLRLLRCLSLRLRLCLSQMAARCCCCCALTQGAVHRSAGDGCCRGGGDKGALGGLEALHVAHAEGLGAVGQVQLAVLGARREAPLDAHAVPRHQGLLIVRIRTGGGMAITGADRGGGGGGGGGGGRGSLLQLEVVRDGAPQLQRGELCDLHIQDAQGGGARHHVSAQEEHTHHCAHL
jgi:hypothetical protein